MNVKDASETPYLDIREVAKKLGYSQRHVRTLIKQGKIQAIKMPGGRKWLIRQSAINKSIDSSSTTQTEESPTVRNENQIDPTSLQFKKEHFEKLSIIAYSLLDDGLDNVIINDIDEQPGKHQYTMIKEHEDVGVRKQDLYICLLANTDITIRKFSQFDVDCLFSHLTTEFPQIEELGYSTLIETAPFELIKILRIVSRRKIFKGTCPVCEDF